MGKKEEVYEYLNEKKIAYEVIDHDPVYTMEEMEEKGITEKGNICKNLFLRDQKGKRHFLVVLTKDKQADLKTLGEKLGAGKLSFASDERLEKYLGLSKGAVSPLGVIHDKEAKVEFVFDQSLMGEKRMGIHPNDNIATVIIEFSKIKKLIEQNGNTVKMLKI